MFDRLIRRAGLGTAAVALAIVLPGSLRAQREGAPAKVTVQATGSAVTVAWAPVVSQGAVTYRVLRAIDLRAMGIDITRPVGVPSVVDPNVVPGATYFYQVIAVFGDGTSAAAAPVGFTVPGAPTVTPTAPVSSPARQITGKPIAIAPGSGVRSPLVKPTAVTGVTVSGTTASAIVTWQPVSGAASYTVKRMKAESYPYNNCCTAISPALTSTTWTDQGLMGIGFYRAGGYTYDVTALLGDGTTVTGQATWTRPDPTCAAPPPSQPMLTILDPTAPSSQFAAQGPYPSGAFLTWMNPKASVIAYRAERSVPGSNAWTLAGTSCGAAPAVSGSNGMYAFIDHLSGIAPNTVYLYRLTAIAANGEAGAGTVSWTAPTMVNPHLLSAVVAGNAVTLRWRYEAPATNAPAPPTGFRVTSSSGFDQSRSGAPCSGMTGCSTPITGVPSGSQKFTVAAVWAPGGGLRPGTTALGTTSADTTITVP